MRQTLSFLLLAVISLLLLGACGVQTGLSVGALGVPRDVEYDDEKNPVSLYMILARPVLKKIRYVTCSS